MKAAFIKLGGSLITDKTTPKSAKLSVMHAITDELAKIHQNNPELVLFIGNGAGSYGHYAVHKTDWKKHKNDPARIAEIRRITSQLNTLVLENLVSRAVPAVSFSPASFVTQLSGETHLSAEALFHFVDLGVVPLVHGDMIFDDKDGSRVLSTEEILEAIAKKWVENGNTIESFIYCTSVDGVLDKETRVIPELGRRSTLHSITTTNGFDVTGGMAQKVEAGLRALSFCEFVYILNGQITGNLTRAINHQNVGTRLIKD